MSSGVDVKGTRFYCRCIVYPALSTQHSPRGPIGRLPTSMAPILLPAPACFSPSLTPQKEMGLVLEEAQGAPEAEHSKTPFFL
jgi:hypothetical protein